MAGLTAVHNEAKRRLEAVFTTPDAVQFGPAEDLPTSGGRVVQCAVLWPTTGVETARSDMRVHQRADAVRVVFVGSTVLDCLAAVQKGRTALQGRRLVASGRGGGGIREGGFTGAEPVPEPGTDPVRVSLTVQFDAVTKGPR